MEYLSYKIAGTLSLVKKIPSKGGVVGMAVQVHLNKSQSMAIAMSILNDIESFCEEHQSEFEEFLKNEERKEAQHGKQRH